MAETYPHLHIVLLADDYGENLWPIARKQAPACFAPAEPGTDESLLVAAVTRTRPYTEHPLHIITNEQLSKLLYGELRTHAGLSPDEFEFIFPPADRGTAFSIALTCACIRRLDPDAVVAVMHVDQYVDVDERWPHLLYAAYQVALQDNIALIATRQKNKCRNVSYIRPGQSIKEIDSAFEVRVFSPDTSPATAARAYHEGAYWYTGVFVSRAAGILGAIANPNRRTKKASAEAEFMRRIVETASFFAMLDRDSWLMSDAEKIAETLTSASIEKAALEHAPNLVMMSTTIGFSTTQNLRDIDMNARADMYGNRIVGNAIAVESRNTTVLAQTKMRFVATYGLEDIAVIDTPDALLVAKKGMLADTDALLAKLDEEGVEQAETSVHRPLAWGAATLISRGEKTATWRVELPAGSTLDSLSIPLEYDVFDRRAAQTMCEQYVVAEGDVLIKSRDEDAASTLVGTGGVFEASAKDPVLIMCVEENPAVLILTAVK